MNTKTTSDREFTITPLLVLDIDASDLFENDSLDWQYCIEHAAFSHREACEFLLHVPSDEEALEELLREMIAYDDCSEDLVDLVRAAWECRAAWLLLHA
jgi:hypothetical protein